MRPDLTETPANLLVVFVTLSGVRRLDRTLESLLARYGLPVLRYTLAIVFFWFGIIKPIDTSPADTVVLNGIYFLPFEIFFPFLGWWEVLVGLGLLYERTLKFAAYLMVFQMAGTMIPLLSASEMTFVHFPHVPSEVGIYIIKNWVLLSGGLVVLARLRSQTDRRIVSRDRRRELLATVYEIEQAFLSFVDRYSLTLLRYSLVVVLVWSGMLTAAGFGETATLIVTSLGAVPTTASLIVLGGWEVATGLALLSRRTVRLAVVLAVIYVTVSLAPLVVFPNETFTHFPYAPSFEGVFLIKNWVLAGGVMTIGGLIDSVDG